jgi:hypothetical protein
VIVPHPEKTTLPPRRYRLRWRFDFRDRPTRRGPWDGGSDRAEDSAWAVPKDGLLRAVVEAEDRETFQTFTAAAVEGQDYATAQWEIHSRIPGLGVHRVMTPRPVVHGLSLLTRDERVTVLVSGEVRRRPLTPDERAMKIHEHRL